jgi:hypothetical protein
VIGPFDDLEEAAQEFASKFKDKTGNTWQAFKGGKFKQKAKKYDCIAVR